MGVRGDDISIIIIMSKPSCDPSYNPYLIPWFLYLAVRKFYGSMDFEIDPPRPYQTPYGGRLVWSLPGGNRLVVHLKDQTLIRKKKRWSQVTSWWRFCATKFRIFLLFFFLSTKITKIKSQT